MKINISNMENNTVYRFGENYIWSVVRDTASNGEMLPGPTKLTEVYRIDNMGLMKKIASGILRIDTNSRFIIYDFAQQRDLVFVIEKPLKKVDLKELYKMQNAIEYKYDHKRK